MIFFPGFHLFLVIIGKNPLRNFLGTIPTCTFIHLQLPIRQICMDREHWVKIVAYVTLNKQEDADLLLPSDFLNPHQKHNTL